jgi:hypothetical protein
MLRMACSSLAGLRFAGLRNGDGWPTLYNKRGIVKELAVL